MGKYKHPRLRGCNELQTPGQLKDCETPCSVLGQKAVSLALWGYSSFTARSLRGTQKSNATQQSMERGKRAKPGLVQGYVNQTKFYLIAAARLISMVTSEVRVYV